MAATVIYISIPDATARAKGVVRVDTANGLTISRGTIGAGKATASKVGVVRPDGTTITVRDGVISTKDYDTEIAELTRRIEELEEALSAGMTYEDGTLFVNAVLEDGTLVTGQTYEDGTLS